MPDSPTTASPAPASSAGAVLKTLLLTDLVDSTAIVEGLGDARAYEVLSRHDRLARDLLPTHNGREIDKTDGFLLLFDRPVDAVRYALAYHRRLEELSEEAGVDLKARAGVHLGEVFLRENSSQDVARGAKPLEVEGLAKPMAARVMSVARGGQTLLTQGAFELARRAMVGEEGGSEELTWLAHGPWGFKGVGEAVQLFEVGQRGIAPLAAPQASEKARRALEDEVTLTGEWIVPDRRGQRLRRWAAIAAAVVVLLLSGFFLAPRLGLFSAGGDRESVAVFGFHNIRDDPRAQWLSVALPEMLATELSAGEELRLISGETIARVSRELELPQGSALAPDTLEKLRDLLDVDYIVMGSYVGQQDQVESVMAVLQDTRRGEELGREQVQGDGRTIYDLVALIGDRMRQRLGTGEISNEAVAAARAAQSSNPRALRLYAEGLAQLRSYDALGARGSFEAAVAADPEFALAHTALSEALKQLGYDRQAETSAGTAFELSEQLNLPREDDLLIKARYYESTGDWDQAVATFELLWRYHTDDLEHGLRLVEALREGNRVEDSLAVIEEVRRLPSPAGDDPRIDLAQARSANQLTELREQLEMAETAVAKGREQGSTILVAEALLLKGWALQLLGQPAEAVAPLEEARDLFLAAGDSASQAGALNYLAILYKTYGDLDRAERLYRQALELRRQTGNQSAMAAVLNNLGVVVREKGELSAAGDLFEEGAQLARSLRLPMLESTFYDNLSLTALSQGRVDEAESYAQRALAKSREVQDTYGEAWAYFDLGRIALIKGRIAEAGEHFGRCLQICQEEEIPHICGFAHHGLGNQQLLAGDLDAAWDAFEDSRRIRTKLEQAGNLANLRIDQAFLLLARGDTAAALETLPAAAQELGDAGRSDLEVYALQSLVLVRLAAGEIDEARATLRRATALATDSESVLVRLQLDTTEARVELAEGDIAGARRRLEKIVEDAKGRGVVELALTAEEALAEAILAAGDTAEGRRRLSELAEEAERLGMGLLASQCRRRLGELP